MSLAAEEQTCACGRRDFPFVVRHGRVLVDNCPAGNGQVDHPDNDNDEWVDVPTGSYRVTAHALDQGTTCGSPIHQAVSDDTHNASIREERRRPSARFWSRRRT